VTPPATFSGGAQHRVPPRKRRTPLTHIAAAAIFAALLLGIFSRASADSAPGSDPTENRPIQRDPSPYTATETPKSTLTSTQSTGFDSVRVALALTAVIGLILIMRTALRRFYPGAIPHRSTQSMRILCRFAVAPRQHVLLLQVGKRLIVVGDGGAQLNPLCEIAAPDEVEAILAQVREESATSLRKFDLFFGKARKNYTEEPIADSDKLPAVPEPDALPSAPAPEVAFDSSHELMDPSLNQTRDELSGLSQKVRDLARQLGRE
jgi:flagellar biogenesis protein FliO